MTFIWACVSSPLTLSLASTSMEGEITQVFSEELLSFLQYSFLPLLDDVTIQLGLYQSRKGFYHEGK
jgi:hypothetical protein